MKNGVINIVGIGSGTIDNMTVNAFKVLSESEIIVGYTTYINQIKELFPKKVFQSSGMRAEVQRCKRCIELAKEGKIVSIVSSGDAGVYGMSGIILEMSEDIEVNVISGVTSCNQAAAALGAPLMNDYVVLSLSDLMTPYDKILKRLEYACNADLVICLYNPRSNARKKNIEDAFDIIKKVKNLDTVVGIVKNAGRKDEQCFITTVSQVDFEMIDMSTMVIVGNSDTIVCNNKMITKRGYKINE